MPQAEQLEIIDDTPLTSINIPQETTPIKNNTNNNQNQNINQHEHIHQNTHQHNNQCNHQHNHQHNHQCNQLNFYPHNFNYHGPNCQCQQHKLSKLQIIKMRILYYYYRVDILFQDLINGIVMPIEGILENK